MSAVLSLLQSRLLRPVFVTLGIALLVQVLVAVALTRSTVTALEADLGLRLGADSQKLSGELEQAGREVTSSLDSLSTSTRQRLTAGLSSRLKDEQAQLRATLEKDLKDSANDMAQLLASVAPRAMWDNDVPTLSEFARRAQRNPNVLFVVYDDATGQHLTRYLNRENPINKALLEKGQGERALDKVLDAAKNDPSVFYLEASINPNGVEIGKVLMGVSTASVETDLAALDKRFSALIASSDQLVGDSLKGAAADSATAMRCAPAVGAVHRGGNEGQYHQHRAGSCYDIALAHRRVSGGGGFRCPAVVGGGARSPSGQSPENADRCHG